MNGLVTAIPLAYNLFIKTFYIGAVILISLVIFGYIFIPRNRQELPHDPVVDTPVSSRGHFDIHDTPITFSYPLDMELVDDTTICSIEEGCDGLRISVREVEVDKYLGNSTTVEDAQSWYLKSASCTGGYCMYTSWQETLADNPGLRAQVLFQSKKNSLLVITGEDTMSADGVFTRVTYIPFFMGDGIAKTIVVSINTAKYPNVLGSVLYKRVYELNDSVVNSLTVSLMD